MPLFGNKFLSSLVCQMLPRRLPSLYKRIAFGCIALVLLYLAFHRRQSWNPASISGPMPIFIVRASRNQSTEGSDNTGTVPKIIHQTWKTRDGIPETFRPWMESWIKLNRDWDYWFWTDEDMRIFMATLFPQYLALYDSYPSPYYRVDAFRYFLLYVHGGVYADLDMECLRPLDDIATKDDCVLSQEPLEHAHFLSELGPPLVSNALMVCKPRHPFFEYVISRLHSYTGFFSWTDILHATGPFMLTDAFKNYHHVWPFISSEVASKVRLANPEEFHPHPDESMVDHMRKMCRNSQGRLLPSPSFDKRQKTLCSKLMSHDFGHRIDSSAYTNHHWTHTWAGKFHDPWGVYDMRMRFPVSDLHSVR